MRKPRLTWTWSRERRGPGPACSERGFVLKRRGQEVGMVLPHAHSILRPHAEGWYWCAEIGGVKRNTVSEQPVWKTAEEAKAACADWLREQIAKGQQT